MSPFLQVSSMGGGPANNLTLIEPEEGPPPEGQVVFSTPGTSNWTVPSGVTSICVVCVGGGGG